MNAAKALAELLKSMFSTDELRRFVRYNYDGVEHDLPTGVGLTTLADAVVAALKDRGFVTGSLFAQLEGERPGRVADIRTVASLWSNATASAPGATPAPTPSAAPAPMSRVSVLTFLKKLSSPSFDEVVFAANVGAKIPVQADQATRAMRLIEVFEERPAGLAGLSALLREVHPDLF